MAPGSNRLLSLAAIVGSLTLLAVVIFMLWPPDPSDTAGLGQADGETVGWVSKVEANTIHVNSGPFGGGVVPLLVTKNTRITVGSKEGWFEDIRPGGQVKVVYQMAHGKRLARTVELLVDEGPRRPGRPEPRVKSVAGGATAERVPTKALAGSPPTPEPRAPETAPTRPPAAAAAPPAGPPPNPAQPAPPEVRPAAQPEPARAQATEPAPPRASSTNGRGTAPADRRGRTSDPTAPQSATQSTPVAGRPAEPSRAAEGESADGAAAVDWLLKGRR
ncbi:MAG TPA: hypothetical protein VMC04_02865 [Verrucomicrobiae bacterium]|nr:hypothetical protein [Verrucomicrobiae bacterium]